MADSSKEITKTPIYTQRSMILVVVLALVLVTLVIVLIGTAASKSDGSTTKLLREQLDQLSQENQTLTKQIQQLNVDIDSNQTEATRILKAIAKTKVDLAKVQNDTVDLTNKIERNLMMAEVLGGASLILNIGEAIDILIKKKAQSKLLEEISNLNKQLNAVHARVHELGQHLLFSGCCYHCAIFDFRFVLNLAQVVTHNCTSALSERQNPYLDFTW